MFVTIETYDQLWDTYFAPGKPIYKYIASLLPGTHIRDRNFEDILHSVFEECMVDDTINRLNGIELQKYIFAIARNNCNRHYSRSESEKPYEELCSVDTFESLSMAHDAVVNTYTPERSYENRELVGCLFARLDEMAEVGKEKPSKSRWTKFPEFVRALFDACDAGEERNQTKIKYRNKNGTSGKKSRPGIIKELTDRFGIDASSAGRYIEEIRDVVHSLSDYPRR